MTVRGFTCLCTGASDGKVLVRTCAQVRDNKMP